MKSLKIVKPESSPKSKSKIQVPNPSPKSKIQRKGTGTGADTIILQATHHHTTNNFPSLRCEFNDRKKHDFTQFMIVKISMSGHFYTLGILNRNSL